MRINRKVLNDLKILSKKLYIPFIVLVIIVGTGAASINALVQLDETESEIPCLVTFFRSQGGITFNEGPEKDEEPVDAYFIPLKGMYDTDSGEIIEISESYYDIESLEEELELYYGVDIIVLADIIPPYKISFERRINLENNPLATDVTWSQLKNFLLEDNSDKDIYIDNVYMCGEYAENLHNNAEISGIRAAFIVIKWEDGSSPHALNAFVTRDKGLVYIDVSGSKQGVERPENIDCVVEINIGDVYYRYLLFPDGWGMSPINKTVSQIEIYW